MLEAVADVGDVWCTGAIQTHGEDPRLLGVEPRDFDAKLTGFLAQPRDRLFLVPAAKFTPILGNVCRAHQVRVHTLATFCAVLPGILAAGVWPEPMVVQVGSGEVQRLDEVVGGGVEVACEQLEVGLVPDGVDQLVGVAEGTAQLGALRGERAAAVDPALPGFHEAQHRDCGAEHVKDVVFRSLPTDDGYHRRGFKVLYRYPGEGVADLPALMAGLRAGVGARDFYLTIEGLDNRADVDDQRSRLEASLELLRPLA